MIFYHRTSNYKNIIFKVIPITIISLFFGLRLTDILFEYFLKKKFVDKLLENEKDSPNYNNNRKLLYNQLNYYILNSE